MTDRDKAHQELASCIADCCGQSGTYEEGLCDAMSVLDGQPTVGKDMNVPISWVSVKDRLPSSWFMVLITGLNHAGESFGVVKGAYDKNKNGWFRDDIGQYDCDRGDIITHWMPLPEPPKEG